MPSIKVRHNVEMAHRLSQTPGKCEQIHGHSWWIELEIYGLIDDTGKILEFGLVKSKFRAFLDSNLDHRLLLHEEDPLLKRAVVRDRLDGYVTLDEDPTTENVAKFVWNWALKAFGHVDYAYKVTVWETSVNCAVYP